MRKKSLGSNTIIKRVHRIAACIEPRELSGTNGLGDSPCSPGIERDGLVLSRGGEVVGYGDGMTVCCQARTSGTWEARQSGSLAARPG